MASRQRTTFVGDAVPVRPDTPMALESGPLLSRGKSHTSTPDLEQRRNITPQPFDSEWPVGNWSIDLRCGRFSVGLREVWVTRNTSTIFNPSHIAGQIPCCDRRNGDSRNRSNPNSQGALMNDSLAVKVREIIAGHLGVNPDHLTDEARFRDDLGADWLDRLELMIAIEDQVVGIEIDDAVVDQIDTIGDLMRVIESVANGRVGGLPGRRYGAPMAI
jgi:acyl carrier protein